MVYDWDWLTSEGYFQKALALNGSCAAAHVWYGNLLTLSGRYNEAVRELRTAHELDPLSLPLNALRAFV